MPTTTTMFSVIAVLVLGLCPAAHGQVTSGRLEIYNPSLGVWGTVCDDYFDTPDGNVACRQLGLGPFVRMFNAAYGSHLPIVADDFGCGGTESSLQSCSHRSPSGSHNCGHSEDVGIECQPGSGSAPRTSARLVEIVAPGAPTANPTPAPTDLPTANPTPAPTDLPTANPTPAPTDLPTANPTANPTPAPTDLPTANPTQPVPGRLRVQSPGWDAPSGHTIAGMFELQPSLRDGKAWWLRTNDTDATPVTLQWSNRWTQWIFDENDEHDIQSVAWLPSPSESTMPTLGTFRNKWRKGSETGSNGAFVTELTIELLPDLPTPTPCVPDFDERAAIDLVYRMYKRNAGGKTTFHGESKDTETSKLLVGYGLDNKAGSRTLKKLAARTVRALRKSQGWVDEQ